MAGDGVSRSVSSAVRSNDETSNRTVLSLADMPVVMSPAFGSIDVSPARAALSLKAIGKPVSSAGRLEIVTPNAVALSPAKRRCSCCRPLLAQESVIRTHSYFLRG